MSARLVAAAAAVAGLALVAATSAPVGAAEAPEARLVRAYAPIVMVRAQEQGPEVAPAPSPVPVPVA